MSITKAGDALDSVLDKLQVEAGDPFVPEEATPMTDHRENILKQKYKTLFGPRFINKTFDNYMCETPRQEQFLDYCRRYTAELKTRYQQGIGMVLVGNSGTGKNHLSYAIGREVLRAGYSLEVRKFLEVMREIKSSWSSGDQKEQDIIDKYTTVDFLFLEEIGVQYGTQNERIFLYDILDGRYKRTKPTFLTSNLTLKEFQEYVDFDGKARIWDRLQETAAVLHFDWQSHRKPDRRIAE